MWTEQEKLERLLRHIELVRDNCRLLGQKLMAQGKNQMGLALYANGEIHDNSKFYGIEWDYLDPTHSNKQAIKHAIVHHHKTNPHHPEYWGHISKMPEVYVAEMTCDWKARAAEFAQCLKDWIDKEGTKRYKFRIDGPEYQLVMSFVDLICDKPFVPIDEIKEEAPQPQVGQESKAPAPTQTN